MTLALNLPLDILWKRICVSEDAITRSVIGDTPPRWRSSLAVLEYQPAEEFQTYEGMTVSYLKVVATLTRFQPGGDRSVTRRSAEVSAGPAEGAAPGSAPWAAYQTQTAPPNSSEALLCCTLVRPTGLEPMALGHRVCIALSLSPMFYGGGVLGSGRVDIRVPVRLPRCDVFWIMPDHTVL